MRAGEIYHVQNVEPLHGGSPKGRYVVIVTNPRDVAFDSPVFVVACTTTVKPEQIEQGMVIELPWNAQGMAATGFRKRTWAVPTWMLKLRPSQLGRRVGHLPSHKLQQIVNQLPPDPDS